MKNKNEMNVTIMGRQFHISCPNEEREELLLAVSYLDKKMIEIKQEAKVVGSERIAIIAALSIAHELLMLRNEGGFDMNKFKRRIELMEEKLDNVLPIDKSDERPLS